MMDLKMEHLTALLNKHRLRFREIVAFRPTGWTFSKASSSISTCRTDATGRIRIYGVPYSEHSSFAELAEFVRVMDPHAIIPTVRTSNSVVFTISSYSSSSSSAQSHADTPS